MVYDPVKRRERAARARRTAFALLGNRCARCGFSDPRAFQVDHIHGAREGHNERQRGGDQLYEAIARGKRPAWEFALLCANCNAIKRHERGEWAGYKAKRFLQ